MKILHSADWHLDSPLSGQSPALREALSQIPDKLLQLCREENCDLVLLAGDLFDGSYTPYTYRHLYDVLKEMAVPVFITPGNHDCCKSDSPWLREVWPENVHIFKSSQIESVSLPEQNAKIYGAGYTAMDCPGLLEGFTARQDEKYAIGILHADATTPSSPYCPITHSQVAESGLDYLALGHIHKGDSFNAGKTLCAWPGCPMGRGYDEPGVKGAYIVTLEDKATLQFRALSTPRFYDLKSTVDGLYNLLPPVGSNDFYRITLTGEADTPDLKALQKEFSRFPNLIFRDNTSRVADIWGNAGADSFEGIYFGLLRQALENSPEGEKEKILLGAKLSRMLIDGQEVVLP